MELAILLDRNSAIPLHRQLTESIRFAILQGRIKPEQKLPSSRVLAKSLSISRTTVTQSYEQLFSEGYLETRYVSGTYVCSQLPDEWLQPEPLAQSRENELDYTLLSPYGINLMAVEQLEMTEPEEIISFRYGSPAIEQFPVEVWRRLLSRHCRHNRALLNYASDHTGYRPLREAIADYLGRSRAVRCTPEQVIVVNGSQQALDAIARLTIDSGDWIAIEEPSYLGARQCFLAQGAKIQPIPVDDAGLDVNFLERHHQAFKLLYTTPSHQFPIGAILSLPRRLALLKWAQQTGTLILEDDYDSEFRYGERPIPALQGLDPGNSVIYIGTFSKVLFPSLRVGYLVVPHSWVSLISQAKWLCDRSTPLLEQYALADFITEGHLERHIRRMRRFYNQQRQVLVQALKSYLGSRVIILGESAGIHLIAKIETNVPDEIVIRRAANKGVGLISTQEYYLSTPKKGEFIFGYANLSQLQIEEGIQKLVQVLKS